MLLWCHAHASDCLLLSTLEVTCNAQMDQTTTSVFGALHVKWYGVVNVEAWWGPGRRKLPDRYGVHVDMER